MTSPFTERCISVAPRTLVDQEHHQIDIRVVGGDGVRYLLEARSCPLGRDASPYLPTGATRSSSLPTSRLEWSQNKPLVGKIGVKPSKQISRAVSVFTVDTKCEGP